MIAAFELHDGLAAGKAAREANRAHRGFGAGTDEADQLDGGHEFDHTPGELRFESGRRAEGQAVRGHALHGRDDRGVRMARGSSGPHEPT